MHMYSKESVQGSMGIKDFISSTIGIVVSTYTI